MLEAKWMNPYQYDFLNMNWAQMIPEDMPTCAGGESKPRAVTELYTFRVCVYRKVWLAMVVLAVIGYL